jgi:hypothetical protein
MPENFFDILMILMTIVRKIFLIIVLALCLASCEKADFETAHRAYQSGDYKQALKQLTILANEDDAKAQNNLGFMCLNGIGVKKNYGDALKWFRKAAHHGVAEAQHSMGFMYAEGLGTAPVPAIALKWYRLAAKQGLSQAQFNLAYMYENEIGIRRNDKEVFYWYREAAKKGNLVAQYKLGLMYLNGIGVEKNQLKAYAWFGVASAGGYEQALSPRDAIGMQLDEEKLTKARNMARELWLMHNMIDVIKAPADDNST